MIKTFKYRLYPSSAQEHKLLNHIELCRLLYNSALEERRSYYKKFNKPLLYKYQQNSLPEVKDYCPEYKLVYSQSLQDVLRRLDKSFINFFRRVKLNQVPGFPRFKERQRYNSLTYSQKGFKIHENKLFLSKIGHIKIILHRKVLGKIKTCTIVKSSTGKWYVCFACEIEKQALPKTGSVVGIDLGLENYLTSSEQVVIVNPKFLNKHLERLAKASQKYSKNKTCAKRKYIARLHEKIKNTRTDWQYKIANQLIKEHDLICLEDLNIQEMKSSKEFGSNMRRSISDASWGQLIRFISYKAEYADKNVVLVDPKNTSKMCSNCSNIKKDLRLDIRIYRCENCNLQIDRDLNAAINIKTKGLELYNSKPESRNILLLL